MPREDYPTSHIEVKALIEDQVEFEIICEPEEIEIHGNASAIDDDTDRETEEWITDQLNSGNEWAWCCVHVIARWKDFEGHDHLGCCSYESEEDFKAGGYWEDMKARALDDLNATIKDQIFKLYELMKAV